MSDPAHLPSLTRRVLGAAAWTLSGTTISLTIRFGANLLLARILAPDVFGLAAIANVVMVGLALFSDLGFRIHIIQSQRGCDPDFLNTTWTVQIIRGFVLTVVALLIAAGLQLAASSNLIPSSSVYADPQLPLIVAVLSSTALISGFLSTKQFEAGRQLALGRVTAIELCGQIVGLIVIFAWLWFDRSIWALIAGNIAGALASTILSHAVLPGCRNSLRWDPTALQELLHLGKWIFLSSGLTFLATSADKLMLGALTGATFIGLYTIAFNLVDLPAQLISKLMGTAAFPALSHVARERARDLKRAYYKFHAPAASVAYLLAGILVVAGPSIITTLYDFRYRDAGWIMQILALSLVATPFQLAGSCFAAIGKPHLISTFLIVRLVVVVIATPICFYFFHLPGAVAAVVLSQFCSLPVIVFQLRRLGLLDVRKELTAVLLFPVGLTVGVGIDVAIRAFHSMIRVALIG
jgi:O-antigen/teichoic acid export membrane protein